MEMERDALLTHGISAYTKECLFKLSDNYYVNVCEKCGGVISSPSECKRCKKSDVATVDLPYATKLLFQSLSSLQIDLKIEVN